MMAVLKWIKDNALSLSMFVLFVGCLFANTATGHHSYNEQQASQGYPLVGYWEYLGTGNFLDGVFVNWQAAALQLTALIIFSEFMSQRGASHSRKPDDEEGGKGKKAGAQKKGKENAGRESESRESSDRPGRQQEHARQQEHGRQQEDEQSRFDRQYRGTWKDSWLYRNSLSIAFIVLFTVSFSLHVVSERRRSMKIASCCISRRSASPSS